MPCTGIETVVGAHVCFPRVARPLVLAIMHFFCVLPYCAEGHMLMRSFKPVTGDSVHFILIGHAATVRFMSRRQFSVLNISPGASVTSRSLP